MLLSSQASSWLAEAFKAVALYALPRQSLRWIWAAPALYVVGGGPVLYAVLVDITIASGKEEHR